MVICMEVMPLNVSTFETGSYLVPSYNTVVPSYPHPRYTRYPLYSLRTCYTTTGYPLLPVAQEQNRPIGGYLAAEQRQNSATQGTLDEFR